MLHAIRDMVDMMWNTSKGIFEETPQRALERGDYLSNRIAGVKDDHSGNNMSGPEKDRPTQDEIIAQVSFLTFAAMDTTSKALSRTFHLPSENPQLKEGGGIR
ncbi:hypothetical protein D9611_006977 [Ephemerocybe angulata]|uniref:Uncharacterized protein n=1 Tax=Ephemerocybe angulata TaxID=980116 RepID=A0A8H5EVS4_9AGAR|nr:hypothetical protein D9611_006977 [Tulosesus angulatus]